MVQLYYKAKLFLRITARIGAAVDTKVFLEVKNKNLLLIYCIWYKPRTETKMVKSKKCFLLVPLTLMNQQKEFLQEMSMKLHTFVNVIRQNPDYKTDACLIGKYTPSYISGYHLAELHLMLGVT